VDEFPPPPACCDLALCILRSLLSTHRSAPPLAPTPDDMLHYSTGNTPPFSDMTYPTGTPSELIACSPSVPPPLPFDPTQRPIPWLQTCHVTCILHVQQTSPVLPRAQRAAKHIRCVLFSFFVSPTTANNPTSQKSQMITQHPAPPL
jgi:hypothetical protein